MRGVETNPLALYLHIPFCDHRCAYCDFNAYAGLDGLIPAYTDALIAESRAWSPRIEDRPVTSVFFGGGTPSLLPPAPLARLVSTIRSAFAVAPDAEWTLEANPGTVDAAAFRRMRALGVNRISLGVQSFDDEELRRLDRIHDAAAAEAAYHAARAAGFDNISLDLMFGLEGQTLDGWARTLDRAVALAPEHLSLYSLTVEEGTPLARRIARGEAPEPDGDLQAEMYERARTRMAAAGYEHYEISNWARPGRACRHNIVYWRDGDWLGLGAGAHAHLDGTRFAVVNSPAAYTRHIRDGATAWQASGQLPAPWHAFVERPDRTRDMADALAMELRLSDGLNLRRFARRWGVQLDAVYGTGLRECIDLGLLEVRGDRLVAPPDRRIVLGEAIARLLAARVDDAAKPVAVTQP